MTGTSCGRGDGLECEKIVETPLVPLINGAYRCVCTYATPDEARYRAHAATCGAAAAAAVR